MLSLLLITALAVQYPQPAPTRTTDSTAQHRSTTRGPSTSAVGRQAFRDRMRELWTEHVAYTRNYIVSASAGIGDTAEVAQRLLRNQDEIGEAIKPYYGDAAGTQLASLLRNHIQLAAKTLAAAKGSSTAMAGMNTQDTAGQYMPSRAGDTVSARTDTTGVSRPNAQYPTANGRMNDTSRARQAARVDSTSLNQAIAALKANGDSIADFLSKANPRGFNQEMLRSAIQMHLTLLLKEATAELKKDWSGSISAYDESQNQILQMADMLSDGIMKQFPSRFSNKATTVSSR
ncbi:MAG TPA: hypothetical protein VKQ05_00455 [Gemmatimonadales bacterium]|nr:hypothetical protein [Gemmatimonadales bacterium]